MPIQRKEYMMIVPAGTPKNEDGSVDEHGTCSLMEKLYADRVRNVVLLGRAGECMTTPFDEKKKFLSAASLEFDGDFYAGVGDPRMENVIRLTMLAADIGAKGVFVPPPAKGHGTPLEVFYERIFKCSGIPVIAYNNPHMTGVNIPLEYLHNNAEMFFGIKDSSGNWDYFLELLRLQERGMKVFQGDESKIFASLEMHADGVVPSMANLSALLCRGACHSASTQIALTGLHQKFYPAGKIVPGIKYTLEKFGVCRRYHTDGQELTESEMKTIDDSLECLKTLGNISSE